MSCGVCFISDALPPLIYIFFSSHRFHGFVKSFSYMTHTLFFHADFRAIWFYLLYFIDGFCITIASTDVYISFSFSTERWKYSLFISMMVFVSALHSKDVYLSFRFQLSAGTVAHLFVATCTTNCDLSLHYACEVK